MENREKGEVEGSRGRRRTGWNNLSISRDIKSVAGWSTMEGHVGDLASWVGASTLLEWIWNGGSEAGEGDEGCKCELHGVDCWCLED